ncbi:DUF1642 domain-containing protein [Streptococcus pneumoniae]|uniref:DUF1642 domain-containing protein n=1 Tax=Streptococcus pneumoniae TaxID=1313 RepID=UPI001C65C78D|nr:DUF1642 domain-containing protein [Streptococcus pneumoniae]MBW8140222.1 DUF1642 domain-containing protein [Streptococcus pneumoniae]
MKVQRLIEKYKELYENVFDFGAKLACQLILQDLEQLDELETGHADEAPRYLKNILARLRELPDHDREVWLKAIMGEFKEDFSHVKWREGYEQGKFEGEWVGNQLKDADKVRRELNKVKVPQFVADWYEENKDSFEFNVWDWIAFRDEAKKLENREFNNWINDSRENPIQTLVNMHQFGYEVEEEKRYLVRIKATKHYFYKNGNGRVYFSLAYKSCFTKKQLEDADFGWVFDCPGIEVEEVE